MAILTLLSIAIILNSLAINSPIIGLIVGLIYLFVYGNKLGRLFFNNIKPIYQRLFGALIFLCLVSILGSLAYYFYKINNAIFIIILIGLPLVIESLTRRVEQKICSDAKQARDDKAVILSLPKDTAQQKLATISFIVLTAACFFLLIHNSTTNAIASPWHVLPKYFFILFGIATIILIKILLNASARESLKLFFTIIYFFLFSSVAYFIYKIGFGYDPFVHLATMKHIWQFSTISPTLYYYVGEYSIIIFLANLFQISIETINKILLLLLFSIYLPTTLFFVYANKLKQHRYLLPLCALFLPVTFFINTTPQGIACLFSLIIIFLPATSYPATTYKLLLSLTTCFIHPFFGVPLLLYSLYSTFSVVNTKKSIKIIAQTLCAAAALLAMPLMFLANAIINGKKIRFNFPALSSIFNVQPITTKKYFDFIPDLIHAIGFNWQIIFLTISIAGIIILITKKRFQRYAAPTMFAAIFAINYLAMKFFMQYKFLTPKEVNDYIGRIADLSRYFLLPIFLYFCSWFLYNLLANKPIRFSTLLQPTILLPIILLLLQATSSFYFSYPIFDNYKNSKFYNVSAADIETVHFINQNQLDIVTLSSSRGGNNYIVLGNQMLAAAALRENGFAKYFGNEFYYSIPSANTDGFYKYYLQMAEKGPDKATAIAAMDAANNVTLSPVEGVDQLYFVMNNYWHDFKKITEKAKTPPNGGANWWHEINNGQNIIFYYQR
ncbi:hypothetical protein HY932_03330 [Candidatus Falkowbacteria bacterium]|nr:hypothetical protein [Candidatus Falkowbacteria bacterium]